ncbi:hypothetical protein RN001_005652 [Aquatica leii]|uniref:Uncharacterized protein n=1 Tax=Aquatica leii TaxID=1421715 RepID=A0AAN7QKG8_9COLE|nr:hypothetical protein RN001_005652 [Aquatica leii]
MNVDDGFMDGQMFPNPQTSTPIPECENDGNKSLYSTSDSESEQPIVYIDERYINESHTSIIQLQVLNPNRKGKQVIVHAGVKCVSSSFVDI